MKNLLFVVFLLSSYLVSAQDIFQKNLYSADRIMENREKLELTDAQASKIKKIHADNAGEFATLKWDLDAANTTLKKMLEAPKVDQASASKQMDEVLRLESLLKKKQMTTLVAIKNELTPAQQKILASTNTVYAIKGSASNSDNLVRVYGQGQGQGSSVIAWNGSEVVSGMSSTSPSVKFQVDNGNPETSPLYILITPDGEKELDNFEKIKPEDIESINVLKGSTATLKYGDKGKNGVVILTLKKNSKYYFQQK